MTTPTAREILNSALLQSAAECYFDKLGESPSDEAIFCHVPYAVSGQKTSRYRE